MSSPAVVVRSARSTRSTGRALSLCALLASATVLSAQTGSRPQERTQTPARPKLSLELLLQDGARLLAPPPAPHWLPGSHAAAFVDPGRGQLVLRAADAEPRDLGAVGDVLRKLSIDVPDGGDPWSLLPEWSLLDDHTLRLEHAAAVWHVPLGSGDASAVLPLPASVDDSDFGPRLRIAPGDGHVAWVQQDDLWVGAADGNTRRVTWDGSDDIVYGDAAHRAEFGIVGGLFWSSDGARLAFYREDQRPIALYPYQDLEATPPAPRHGRYPMAGDPNSRVTVGVYDVATQALCWLEHDDAADLYWTNITFAPDARTLLVAQVSRGQDRLELVRFDATTGKRLAVLRTESDAEWIEPEHGPEFLADGRFLWWSPRDGFLHLYLCDTDGRELLQVTTGAFDVQQLLAVREADGCLWFQAAGDDPRQLHLFRAALDGSGVRQVTRERGSHDVAIAPDGRFACDQWSNLELPPALRFVDLRDGGVAVVPQAPSPLLDVELPECRQFELKADDGAALFGSVLLPRDPPPDRRLPALLYVYGGPHVQLVQDRWLAGASPALHALANDGYVVCRLDNRGTPHRGQAFEQAVFRHLGTLEVQDQLRAAAWLRQQPFVDPARIAVHGWSFGGYMTLRLLLQAPGTFACGISGAPVTDWAMYETGYTERYMDTPQENPTGYQDSSCLPLAAQLRDPLLLVHGTDDRTVMWSHTLRFVDRCVDAGAFLEYFPYLQQTHRLRGADAVHFQRLLRRFLARHLQPTGN